MRNTSLYHHQLPIVTQILNQSIPVLGTIRVNKVMEDTPYIVTQRMSRDINNSGKMDKERRGEHN